MEKNNKIVLATRAIYDDKFNDYINFIKKLKFSDKSEIIHKVYVICNLRKKGNKINENDNNIELIFDQNPTRQTAFNLVIGKLKKEEEEKGNKYHLLTFSKEVDIDNDSIKRMIKELNEDLNHLIVVGYRLRDNILSDEERKLYSNGINNNKGIAYQIPWSTCALWNRKFIYDGEGKESLKFDEICEEGQNQLGKLIVKIDGNLEETDYKGMEDGLAITELVTKNRELKFKLIEEQLGWNISGDEKKVKEHKKKMARKNIVLATFINIKGYSIGALRRAKM